MSFTSICQLFTFCINLTHKRTVGNPSAIEGQTVNIKNLWTGLLAWCWTSLPMNSYGIWRGSWPRRNDASDYCSHEHFTSICLDAYLKSGTFLLYVPNEWFFLNKNLSYMHLKTPAAEPQKEIHYRTLPPIVTIICLSFSQPILWDVPKSFVAIHSPPPPPPPVTPYMALTIRECSFNMTTRGGGEWRYWGRGSEDF